MRSIPLARHPTPFPEKKQPLLTRLFGFGGNGGNADAEGAGGRVPASSLPRPAPTESASSSTAAGTLPPPPPRTLKFTRTLSLPQLMRSPTPYPEHPHVHPRNKRAPAWRTTLKRAFSLSRRSSTDGTADGQAPAAAAAAAIAASRSGQRKARKLALIRSPTPYPENHVKRTWWGGKKKKRRVPLAAAMAASAGAAGAGATPTGASSSAAADGRPEIVILRKEPIVRRPVSSINSNEDEDTVPTQPEQQSDDVNADASAVTPAAAGAGAAASPASDAIAQADTEPQPTEKEEALPANADKNDGFKAADPVVPAVDEPPQPAVAVAVPAPVPDSQPQQPSKQEPSATAAEAQPKSTEQQTAPSEPTATPVPAHAATAANAPPKPEPVPATSNRGISFPDLTPASPAAASASTPRTAGKPTVTPASSSTMVNRRIMIVEPDLTGISRKKGSTARRASTVTDSGVELNRQASIAEPSFDASVPGHAGATTSTPPARPFVQALVPASSSGLDDFVVALDPVITPEPVIMPSMPSDAPRINAFRPTPTDQQARSRTWRQPLTTPASPARFRVIPSSPARRRLRFTVPKRRPAAHDTTSWPDLANPSPPARSPSPSPIKSLAALEYADLVPDCKSATVRSLPALSTEKSPTGAAATGRTRPTLRRVFSGTAWRDRLVRSASVQSLARAMARFGSAPVLATPEAPVTAPARVVRTPTLKAVAPNGQLVETEMVDLDAVRVGDERDKVESAFAALMNEWQRIGDPAWDDAGSDKTVRSVVVRPRGRERPVVTTRPRDAAGREMVIDWRDVPAPQQPPQQRMQGPDRVIVSYDDWQRAWAPLLRATPFDDALRFGPAAAAAVAAVAPNELAWPESPATPFVEDVRPQFPSWPVAWLCGPTDSDGTVPRRRPDSAAPGGDGADELARLLARLEAGASRPGTPVARPLSSSSLGIPLPFPIDSPALTAFRHDAGISVLDRASPSLGLDRREESGSVSPRIWDRLGSRARARRAASPAQTPVVGTAWTIRISLTPDLCS
ncbi:hypothetical protein AMAG_02018 [Allomyces macrogynus ATCC 38327]|uniref:Uncharacterized protein n=1 Tax=Allomyces macrogynus (strain ATCC 38327) TaxID=578462 RepID=A0A0L0S1E7_ALLM3|nr:hypothetical protein AMAG_02018 [Allomyces macrogynus ATCC 38327]|eukprot:KNE56184.1 hypothetical protein AMAG_02018 [Allomyces macrogynus ATCC 38327]